eukprot:scaffold49508_cov67-Phaeocystis_antarctica.AAC.2
MPVIDSGRAAIPRAKGEIQPRRIGLQNRKMPGLSKTKHNRKCNIFVSTVAALHGLWRLRSALVSRPARFSVCLNEGPWRREEHQQA